MRNLGERSLGSADAEHDPISLEMIKVVEHQTADRHRPQAHCCRRLRDVIESGIVGVKGQRNEGLEAAGLIKDTLVIFR